MKIIGIIAEFNPFHNGHARLLSFAKNELSADYVIAVMSGDFVQRGEPACQSRHARAKQALCAGFDAVLSLPVGISTASAEAFAEGGVRALSALGCVDTLLFGSESGNLNHLQSCAEALLGESPSRSETLKSLLKSGDSYPKARAAAYPEYAGTLQHPNNILAIEYCKAIRKSGSSLRPCTLRREENYHDSLSHTAPSAESIRRMAEAAKNRQRSNEDSIRIPGTVNNPINDSQGSALPHRTSGMMENPLKREELVQTSIPSSIKELIRESMPCVAAELFLEDYQSNALVTADDFSLLLGAALFKALTFEDYLPYAGVSEDLARRIFEKRHLLTTFRAFAETIKSKNSTLTAVSRALLAILLEVSKESQLSLPYLRLLGYRKEAQPLIRKLSESGLPVLFRIAEAKSLADNASARAHLRREIVCTNLYELIRSRKSGTPFHEDALLPIIRI